ncbi:hypothetical protein VP01_1317g2, partial [Puccinia sorghi]
LTCRNSQEASVVTPTFLQVKMTQAQLEPIWILSLFNYAFFSQNPIPTSHCSIYLKKYKSLYESSSKIGTTGIAAKVEKDPEGYCQLQTHFPKKKHFHWKKNLICVWILMVLLAIYPSLSPNLPTYKNDDVSPFTFFMWIPIEQTMGNLVKDKFEVQAVCGEAHDGGSSLNSEHFVWEIHLSDIMVEDMHAGEFFFPDDSCGIDFSGFSPIYECALKSTAYSHLTLPSHNSSHSLNTCMRLSCQLSKKTQATLEKIKNTFYENQLKAYGILEI